jgi:hypothetical protein
MDPRVRQYMLDKYFKGAQQPDFIGGMDDEVKAAQQKSDMASMAGVAAGAADNIANSMNQPVALKNRMQDLGKAPEVIQGRQQRTDVSGIQRMADRNLDSAKSDRDQALQMALQQRKEELAAQAAASRQAVEDERWNKQFGQKQSEIDATNSLRNATLQNTQSQQGIANGFRREELDLQKQKNAAAGKEMPIEDKEVVKNIAQKNAGKIAIANQIESYLKEFKDAKDQNTKLRIGGQMMKVLNSPEGADAIGAEEAKRLGDALEFHVANVFGAGPMFGRDLPGFETQAQATLDAVRGSAKANQDYISTITKKAPTSPIQSKNSGVIKMQDASGRTFNIPADQAAEAEADGLKRI